MQTTFITWLPVFVFVTTIAGCVTGPQPIPRWAIHVKKPHVSQHKTTAQLLGTLKKELSSPHLKGGHLTAEEIAAASVNEIQNKHYLDSIILLAISSYRYNQQAANALELAKANADSNLRHRPQAAHEAYWEIVKNEVVMYYDLTFYDQMEYAMFAWQKDAGLEKIQENTRSQFSSLTPERNEHLAKKLVTELEIAATPSWEELAYPELAEVFLSRLSDDIDKDNDFSGFAQTLLAKTPLKRFHHKALFGSRSYFHGELCEEIVGRYSAYQTDVSKAYGLSRPETRANAVMIFSLKGDAEGLEKVKADYETIKNPKLKLVYDYAMARLGNEASLRKLNAAAMTCQDEETCNLSIQLIQWLPSEMVAKLNSDSFTAILNNDKNTATSRGFAALILGEIAHTKPVTKETIDALLTASEDKNDRLAQWATSAIQHTQQLNAKKIIWRLDNGSNGKTALYLRLIPEVSNETLPFIEGQVAKLANLSQNQQVALIAALDRISDARAERLMWQVYRGYPNLQFSIARMISSKKHVDPTVLRSLAQNSRGAPNVVFSYVLKDPAAPELLRALLTRGTPEDRYQGTMLAMFYNEPEVVSEMWQLASYWDARYFPNDALIRYNALGTLVVQALIKSAKKPEFESLELAPKSK